MPEYPQQLQQSANTTLGQYRNNNTSEQEGSHCQAQPMPKQMFQLWAKLFIISSNPPNHPDKYEGDRIKQNLGN